MWLSCDLCQELFGIDGLVFTEPPQKDIHNFVGKLTMVRAYAQ